MAKILLVEDDNNLREIYQARLAAEGYEIATAQDGEEALVVAKKEHPDLIISDVMMPRISGFEMLDILRNTEELKHTKIIMLTALGQAEDQARADNLGADKYLVKSQVTLEDIVNSAKELLGESTPAETPATVAVPEPAPAAPVAPQAPEETPVTDTPVTPSASPSTPEPLAAAPNPSPAPVAPAPEPSFAPPASVVPQPGTSVVVPPAPANPAPVTVTSTPVPPPEPPLTPDEPPKPQIPNPVVTPPEPAQPSTPTPVSQPDSTESVAAAPAVTDSVVNGAEESVESSVPQSLQAEEAAIQAQIDNFSQAANTASETPATPTAGVVSPESDKQKSDDAVIANAVEQLDAATQAATQPPKTTEPAGVIPAPQPATPTPVSEPTDTADPAAGTPTSSEQVPIAHKKIIKPISDMVDGRPNLDELLAKEAAKEAGSAPQIPVVNGAPQPPSNISPNPTGGQSNPADDPNNVAL